MKAKVGVSNRHVHLTKEHFNILFSDELVPDRMLLQEGEFASNSFVTLKTDKGIIEHVRVLGPLRNYTQVEISKTDAYKLGLNPPIRTSGDVTGSSPITLIGNKGSLDLNEGCIIPNRHIHLSSKQAAENGLADGDLVYVKVRGEKHGIIGNVHLKINDTFTLELHLDTDDANAFLLKTGDEIEIMK